MRCKYSIYWAIHLYRDNFYIFAFESATRYVYFMSWSVWIWATNTGLHFLIFSFTTLWSFKFVRKSCIKVYEESKILNLEVIFHILSFGVRCYGSIPHKMNLVLAIWTYHIYIRESEILKLIEWSRDCDWEKRYFSSQRTGNKFHMDHMHSESIFSGSNEDWLEFECNKSYNTECYRLRSDSGWKINARIKQATTRRICNPN
jgi:hypothetical protein